MKTDTDALAAYFEAWREGWPVPGCWWRSDDGNWHRYFYDRAGCTGDKWSVHGATPSSPSAIDIQALTGVLVVELARRPAKKGCYPDDILYWAAKGLPGVVRLWLEVNK